MAFVLETLRKIIDMKASPNQHNHNQTYAFASLVHNLNVKRCWCSTSKLCVSNWHSIPHVMSTKYVALDDFYLPTENLPCMYFIDVGIKCLIWDHMTYPFLSIKLQWLQLLVDLFRVWEKVFALVYIIKLYFYASLGKMQIASQISLIIRFQETFTAMHLETICHDDCKSFIHCT